MANELQIATNQFTGPVYALVRNEAGLIWDTVSETFVTYVSADRADYTITCGEEVPDDGYWIGSFPTAITQPGLYAVVFHFQSGATPADDDLLLGSGNFSWDGVSEAVFVTNWLSTANVKSALNITNTANDAQIAVLIPQVEQMICDYLRTIVLAAAVQETQNGKGANYIRTYSIPVNSLTSIVFDVDGGTSTTIAGTEFLIQKKTGIIKFKSNSSLARGFTEGFQNIQLNYNAGYFPVPFPLILAGALVIQKVIKASGGWVTSKQEGDRKQSYAVPFLSMENPLFFDSAELLKPYRNLRYI